MLFIFTNVRVMVAVAGGAVAGLLGAIGKSSFSNWDVSRSLFGRGATPGKIHAHEW